MLWSSLDTAKLVTVILFLKSGHKYIAAVWMQKGLSIYLKQ